MTKTLSKSQKMVVVGVTAAIVLMLVFSHSNTALATNKGLRINVSVDNAQCVSGENAKISATANGNSIFDNVVASSSFSTQLQFGENEVQNGDNVNVWVTISGDSKKQSVTNGEEKKPESVFFDWNCGSNSGSSSSAAAAASSSSSSSNTNTAVATSSLCLIFCGDDQQNKDNSLSNSNDNNEESDN